MKAVSHFFGACAALAVASGTFLEANAQADLVGAGSNLCRGYIDIYDQTDLDSREEISLVVGQWALGYMSALNNDASPANKRDLSGYAFISFGEDILARCRTNPDQVIANIVEQIYAEAPALNGPTS